MSLDAEFAVGRLIARYADIATRMAWDEMSALVTADAVFTFDLGAGPPLVLHGPIELVGFGERACASFSFYNYTSLNHVVRLSDDTHATGRVHALEVGLERDSGAWTEYYGRYDDAYLLSDGRWRFARRRFRVVTTRRDGDTTVHEPGESAPGDPTAG